MKGRRSLTAESRRDVALRGDDDDDDIDSDEETANPLVMKNTIKSSSSDEEH